MPWPDWHYCADHRHTPCILPILWRCSSRRNWWHSYYMFDRLRGTSMDTGQFACHTQHQLILFRRIDMEHIRHSLHSIHQHTQHNLVMLYCKDTFRTLQSKHYRHQDRWYQCDHCIHMQHMNRPSHADFQNSQVHIGHSVHQYIPRHTRKSKSAPLLRRIEKRMVLWDKWLICSDLKLSFMYSS